MGSLGKTTCTIQSVHSILALARKDSNVCTTAKEYLRAHSPNIYIQIKKVGKKNSFIQDSSETKNILYIFILCVKAFCCGKDRYNNDINYVTYYVT